jgi:hypothetical protein
LLGVNTSFCLGGSDKVSLEGDDPGSGVSGVFNLIAAQEGADVAVIDGEGGP